MKNFLVVNLGGSGSMFLANLLNKSKQWNIEHEGLITPSHKATRDDINKANEHFNRNYYGEVNGFFRFHLDFIEVEKKAIILRDLNDIYLSWFGHYGGFMDKIQTSFYQNIDRLHYETLLSLRLFDGYISNGVKVIDFKKMTTDPKYTTEIARYLGVEDVEFTKADLVKKNSHKKKGYTYDDIPFYYRNLWELITESFNKKYT